MRRNRCLTLGAFLWLVGLALTAPTRAQTLPLVGAEDGDADAGAAVVDLEAAQAQLEQDIETWGKQAEAFQRAHDTAPEKLAEVDAELAALREGPRVSVPEGANAEQLGYRLELAEEELSKLQAEAAELEAEPQRRALRRKALPGLIADARSRLRQLQEASLTEELRTESDDAEDLRLDQLRRTALQQELAAYEAELNSYDARVTLLARRRDLSTQRVSETQAHVMHLREALAEAQRASVAADAQRARTMLQEIDGLPEKVQLTVRELAETNLAFSELWTGDDGLVEKIATVSERLTRARSQVSSVRSDLTRLTAKVEAAGLAESVGTMLRRERARAPDVGMYERFVRMRKDQITDAQLQQLRLSEQREMVADVESRVREALTAMSDQLAPEQRGRVEKLLRELFDNQRKYMDALVADHDEYLRKLVEFDEEQRELIDQSQRLIDFINERVLWVRSGGPMGPELLSGLIDSFAWLTGPRYLRQLVRGLIDSFGERPFILVMLALCLVAFLSLRRRLVAQIRELSAGARASSRSSFKPTAQALGLTLVLAIIPPALLFGFAHILEISPAATQYTRAIAHGLGASALFWASVSVTRALLTEEGVAQAHCLWPRVSSLRLRRHLAWLGYGGLCSIFVMFVAESRGDDTMRESLARLAFLLTMAATGVFAHVTLREHGALNEILRTRRSRRLSPATRRGIHAALTAAPFLLAIAAGLGFYWTTLQLAQRLHLTLTLVFAILIGSDLLHRWAAIAQHSVAEAREAEARQAELERMSSAAPGEAGAGRPSVVSSNMLDLDAVSEQTRRLTASLLAVAGVLGLSGIWADLLPAAGILRQVELWRVQKELTPGSAEDVAAQALGQTQWVPITLADLAVALVIGAICWVLLRNLPGLLEVTLFRRLHAGERYAFATILKYAIAVTGVTLALQSLGISWSSLQWLVAAVGLGLGFGLQEIFANFVSGLLILLERPIRVGDTVTVSDVSGTVSRIHIRATTITTFERKELIVPNKEFVTSQLVNWSLSDPVLRVTVPVGIAYGSDVEAALAALRKVADDHPLVIDEPEPQVLFLNFGDSALGLELRAFVGDSGQALRVKHELHVAVDQALREAGIEIPFPQRDLHIKSLPAPKDSNRPARPEADEAGKEEPA